jgi:hypothetical protein
LCPVSGVVIDVFVDVGEQVTCTVRVTVREVVTVG